MSKLSLVEGTPMTAMLAGGCAALLQLAILLRSVSRERRAEERPLGVVWALWTALFLQGSATLTHNCWLLSPGQRPDLEHAIIHVLVIASIFPLLFETIRPPAGSYPLKTGWIDRLIPLILSAFVLLIASVIELRPALLIGGALLTACVLFSVRTLACTSRSERESFLHLAGATAFVFIFDIAASILGQPIADVDTILLAWYACFIIIDGRSVQLPSSCLRLMLRWGASLRVLCPLIVGCLIILLTASLMHRYIWLAVFVLSGTTLSLSGQIVAINRNSLAVEKAMMLDDLLIEDLVGVDGLTRLMTRKRFMTLLHACCLEATVSGRSVAVVLAEIDELDELQSDFGRLLVDHYVSEIACSIREMADQTSYLVSRISDGTFAVLVPNCSIARAQDISARLTQQIAALALERPETPQGIMTLSTGAACTDELISDAGDLLQRARDSLHSTKLLRREQRTRRTRFARTRASG